MGSLGEDIATLVATLHASVRWASEAMQPRWQEYGQRINARFGAIDASGLSTRAGRVVAGPKDADIKGLSVSYLPWVVETLLGMVALPINAARENAAAPHSTQPNIAAFLDGLTLVPRRMLVDIPT